MSLTWGDWAPYAAGGSHSPYVAWFNATKPPQAGPKPSKLAPSPSDESPAAAILSEFPTHQVPMREGAENADFWPEVFKGEKPDLGIWRPKMAAKDVPELPPDAVIVGVVDRGIPLHHARLTTNGKSRIIAAWQQDALWQKGGPSFLPMGREVFQKEIDATVASYGADEDAINQAFGLLDMSGKNAPRSVARRQSHGAAVLDLASGYAPGARPDNLYVIAVNLPDRETIGLSGTFLDYFTTLAMYRIAALADWLWAENSKRWNKAGISPTKGQEGFPCVINLSFGKNAGPKQGTGFFHNMIMHLRETRPAGAPLSVVIPTGNDNLAQGHALLNVAAKGGSEAVGWMVSPEDQSQNFVEIWTDPVKEAAVDQIGIDVALLGHPTAKPAPIAQPVTKGGAKSPKIGLVRYLKQGSEKRPYAALYRRQFPEPGSPGYVRVQFTLAALPTLDHGEIMRTVPSGEWRITLSNQSTKPITASLSVQTDQSPLPSSAQGLRSYFTDDSYRRFGPGGRVQDSYDYPFTAPPTDTDLAKKVSRHGSLNATASAPGTVIVAGHLVGDGRPADYSATGPKKGADWQIPTVSLPTEAGVVHAGVMTAGSREGYALPAPGTSFASAQATRVVAEELARLASTAKTAAILDGFDAASWIGTLAGQMETVPADAIPTAKVGQGRLPWPEPARQDGRIFG
ncbi:MAG: hypothetical protein AAF340_08965 [Pseudomonadota bacterium]